MALRDEPVALVSLKPAAGALALAFLAVLAGGACLSLAVEALRGGTDGFAAFDSYLWRITRFTLLQALLSMLLSIAFAIPLARALHAHPTFPGRAMILRLFALPLALPALVAVLGVTSIYGRNGFVALLFNWLGFNLIPNIYGLTGILIAHVFFNLPLATRFILAGLDTIPEDYWKLSSQLGMGGWARFRLIEWPVMRRHLSGIAGLIFMLCVTSFTVVLTLGGGPRATTLEVAIYQSLHFDFDIARAVSLTLVQLCLTVAVLAVLSLTGRPTEEGFSLRTTSRRFDQPTLTTRLLNGGVIMLGLLFVALPIAGTVVSGLAADLSRLLGESEVWRAILTSVLLGATAAGLALIISLSLVVAREYLASHRGYASPKLFERLIDRGASLILVIPPIVIGSGWFILSRYFVDPFSLAPFMVVSVNAAMAIPFAFRILRPAWDTAASRHNRLCAQLGLHGWNRLHLIDWPVMKRPSSVAFAFAMALSLGDLGTIALFGNDLIQTLPYLLLQRMGSYRTQDAAGLALILGVLCLLLMIAADRGAATSAKREVANIG
ncbi:thiamine/thiamine pyrophosphate ABC transporter permease [Phyllobacterium endophyticum]|uniref:Thiamine transport system permease protein ThiP n=1 Tax=Phyllobacterium endophyticum TaxID=1149773 RepID=A0A2P7AYH8_9HYPH|nr:thiamine/thiamine pyrophosphate ABC transporter permease [Phyllobacterium endophyticum]MBB3236186.1 thiamine transport system permease protein [Phyllobacterium endophyticum]PSH59270.1 thiamine/thiamine pyrophosphate ABC transporter, permease protein [Phyllobacterium endophyticum]TXR49117.1 thiamine/thiamine pyrophosphate ABC transporter, permease protein [Phyllobacterium endophyticum]TYR41395.1 thiamine/thiamine pyrophosphate ABC transporter, permease protein [Phyllobacterium endophyticum]